MFPLCHFQFIRSRPPVVSCAPRATAAFAYPLFRFFRPSTALAFHSFVVQADSSAVRGCPLRPAEQQAGIAIAAASFSTPSHALPPRFVYTTTLSAPIWGPLQDNGGPDPNHALRGGQSGYVFRNRGQLSLHRPSLGCTPCWARPAQSGAFQSVVRISGVWGTQSDWRNVRISQKVGFRPNLRTSLAGGCLPPG